MRATRTGAALVVAAASAAVLAACSGSSGGNNSGTTPTPTVSPTQAAPSQKLTITPDTGLTNGQTVTLVGTGYTPGTKYGMTECANKGAATGAGDCDLANIKISPAADSSGTVHATFKANAGPFGANHVDCTKKPYCLISLATAGSPSPTEVAATVIKFKK